MPLSPEADAMRLANRTRVSQSIPRRLVLEGKLHLLPVYALLRTSDLAREGIENSGSFRFADHIYRGEPSGRYGVGTLLDSVLLRLRGARSMRSRFFHSQREILTALSKLDARAQADDVAPRADTDLHTVVSIPSGISRDLYEVAESLLEEDPHLYERTRFIGIDLDSAPLDISRDLTRGHRNFTFVQGDALDSATIPSGVDVIVSLGLGEFLSDESLLTFYRNCHTALRAGGVFITSAMSRDRMSDYLARELAELRTNYRSANELRALLKAGGFDWVRTGHDKVGLQTLAVAGKTGGGAT